MCILVDLFYFKTTKIHSKLEKTIVKNKNGTLTL